MDLKKIKVHNYNHESRLPCVLEVDAYCVGGDTGVRAYFIHPENHDWLVMCDGDDGHWWVNSIIHRHWIKGMIMALEHVNCM